MALVEEILSCQPVKNRNTGAVWDCMDSHRASFWLLKCVQLHGAPIEAGCISDFHIFQLHLGLYQIVCNGPGNVTSAVFSDELCCGCLNDDT